MNKKHRGATLRMALRLQQLYVTRASPTPDRQLTQAAEAMLYHAQMLDRQLRLSHRAGTRGWLVAARATEQRAQDSLRSLQHSATQAVAVVRPGRSIVEPTLRDLYADLLQL